MDMGKIEAMRAGGKILAGILKDLSERVVEGVNELELDAWTRGEIVKRGATVAYDELEDKFPGAICISVNDELIHGVPKDYALEDGDKVSFDLTIGYRGYYVDSTFTKIIGKGSAGVRHLVSVTESAMYEGIERVKAGVHIGDVGAAVERTLKGAKLGVITNYIGHGIGRTMHESPEVPNYGVKGQGYILKVGDAICIEPMSSMEKPDNYIDEDGWTVKLKDGSVGAHWEHTVLVTEDGYEILTAWE